MVKMPFDHDRTIMALDVNGSGRRIVVVMMLNLVPVMPVGMAAGVTATVVSQGNSASEKQDDGSS
jgi:hypothetical protein